MTEAPSDSPVDNAVYGFGEQACRTCRKPMDRDEGVRPAIRRADGATQSLVMLETSFLHREQTDCTSTRASPVLGYTTQGLAVFKATVPDPHQPARGIPPWLQFTPASHKEPWQHDPSFRHLEPDTTNTEWWTED